MINQDKIWFGNRYLSFEEWKALTLFFGKQRLMKVDINMTEYIREVQIYCIIDTNKQTIRLNFDSMEEAISELSALISKFS